MKFKLQTEDEINSNNFIANALETGAQRRYQMCKALLSLQDPRIVPKPNIRETCPNYDPSATDLFVLE